MKSQTSGIINTVILGFAAAVFASSAAVGQIATLNIRVHKDNALVNPAPGTLVDVTGDTPVSGPTSHDDNGDTITDRVSYIYNVVS